MECAPNQLGDPTVIDEFLIDNNPEIIEAIEIIDAEIGLKKQKFFRDQIPSKLIRYFEREWERTPGLTQKAAPQKPKKFTSDDILAQFLKEIGSFPLLTKDGEAVLSEYIALGNGADEGDEEFWRGVWAKDKLMCSNLRLVVSIAKKYHKKESTTSLMDLIQDATVGLERAVVKFDHRKGFKFSTYATWWIRQSLGKATFVNEYDIRVPVLKLEKVRRLLKIEQKLEAEGIAPTKEKIAGLLNTDIKEVENLLLIKQQLNVLSLNFRVSNNGTDKEESTLESFLGSLESGYEIAEDKLILDALKRTISRLDERSMDIINRRFGLNGHDKHTLDQLSEIYGITREAIRQQEKRAIDKLRSFDEIMALKVTDL